MYAKNGLEIWGYWVSALEWCNANASGDCSILTDDWGNGGAVDVLKYEQAAPGSGNFFFRGHLWKLVASK